MHGKAYPLGLANEGGEILRVFGGNEWPEAVIAVQALAGQLDKGMGVLFKMCADESEQMAATWLPLGLKAAASTESSSPWMAVIIDWCCSHPTRISLASQRTTDQQPPIRCNNALALACPPCLSLAFLPLVISSLVPSSSCFLHWPTWIGSHREVRCSAQPDGVIDGDLLDSLAAADR